MWGIFCLTDHLNNSIVIDALQIHADLKYKLEGINLLPKLNDRRSGVLQLLTGLVHEGVVADGAVLAGVMAEGLDAARSVPVVCAGGPGQYGGEGIDEVIESPCQDHDVVGVAEEHYNRGSIAESWHTRYKNALGRGFERQHTNLCIGKDISRTGRYGKKYYIMICDIFAIYNMHPDI